MAVSQISTSVTIIDSLLGFQAVSLTAFDTASVPTIAAGSKVEVAGAFFTFSSDESINATSWTAISTGDTAYITLTPSGTAGSQILTAAWTSTAPAWSTSKQGYYASAGSDVRVCGGCIKKGTSGSEYDKKWIYNKRSGESNVTPMTILYEGTCTSAVYAIQIANAIPDNSKILSTTIYIDQGTYWQDLRRSVYDPQYNYYDTTNTFEATSITAGVIGGLAYRAYITYEA